MSVASAPFALVLLPPLLTPVQDPSPAQYLDELLELVETRWYFVADTDWEAVHASIGKPTSNADAMRRVEAILRAGGDHHSFFLDPDAYAAIQGTDSAPDADGPPSSWADVPTVEGMEFALVADAIGYVRTPAFGSLDPARVESYATQLYEGIRALSREDPVGWVVDVRGNIGGNSWPMLAGLSHLIGEGRAGSFLGLDATEHWILSPGASWSGPVGAEREARTRIATRPMPSPATLPRVAVLTDGGTASSGEMVALAFRARRGARSFGAPTAGSTTGNERLELSDGGCLFLSTSVYADRAGTPYPNGVPCDQEVAAGSGDTGPLEETDPVLQAALIWLFDG